MFISLVLSAIEHVVYCCVMFIFHGSWLLDVYIMVTFTLEISFTVVLIKTSRIHRCDWAPASWVNEWKWWATWRCEFCTPEIAVASWNWEPGWGGRAGNATLGISKIHEAAGFFWVRMSFSTQKKHFNFSWWSSLVLLDFLRCCQLPRSAEYMTWLFSDISMTHPSAAWGEAKNRLCFISSCHSG